MQKETVLTHLNKRVFYESFLPTLKTNGTAEAKAICPFHDDHNPSLSVNLEKGVYKCFSCNAAGDVFAFYQRMRGVDFQEAVEGIARFAGINGNPGPVVATFKYTDVEGKELYVKERREPGKDGRSKDFIFKPYQRGGNTPVPFNLPALAKAKYVIVVEGEGKVEVLKEWGLVATCFDTGFQSPWHSHYLPYFKGKEKVVVLPDNDPPGREYAHRIAKALHGHVKEIKIVELPGLPEKGDIIDWQAAGGNKEQLREIIKESPVWSPPTIEEKPRVAALPREDDKCPKRGQDIVNGRLCYKTRAGYLIAGEQKLYGKGESSKLYRFTEKGISRYLEGDKPRMSDVYDRILQQLSRYFIWREPYLPHVVALWVIGTYFATLFDWYAYLWLNSPTKRCGKTRLLDLLNRLVFNGSDIQVAPTPAVLYRQADREFPTLLIDEFERLPKEAKTELLGILNQGARRGGVVHRCRKNTFDLEQFETYCPKVLAGIARLSDTLMDRVLEIQMVRKKPKEKTARLILREITEGLDLLRDDLYLTGLGYDEQVYEGYRGVREILEDVQLPDEIDDRLLESVEPLFVIAGIIAVEKGDTGTIYKLKKYVTAQAETRNTPDEGDNIQAAVRVLAGLDLEQDSQVFTSKQLLELFREDPALEWCERRNQAARLMNKLGFYSATHKVHGKPTRGYKVTAGAITDLRERYGE